MQINTIGKTANPHQMVKMLKGWLRCRASRTLILCWWVVNRCCIPSASWSHSHEKAREGQRAGGKGVEMGKWGGGGRGSRGSVLDRVVPSPERHRKTELKGPEMGGRAGRTWRGQARNPAPHSVRGDAQRAPPRRAGASQDLRPSFGPRRPRRLACGPHLLPITMTHFLYLDATLI